MLIFGTQGREDPRGVVAERCAVCREITRFLVVAHFEVAHVYFMPIGEGRHKQTSMQCMACRTRFRFERERYAEILPLPFGRACAIDDLIVRTNPGLAEDVGLLRRDDAPPPPAPQDEMSRCGACGFERRRPFRFCPKCGHRAL